MMVRVLDLCLPLGRGAPAFVALRRSWSPAIGRSRLLAAMPGAGAAPQPSTLDQAIEAAKVARAASAAGGSSSEWTTAKQLNIDAAQLLLRAANEPTNASRKDMLKATAGDFVVAAEAASQRAAEQALAELTALPVPASTVGLAPTSDGPSLPAAPEPQPQPQPVAACPYRVGETVLYTGVDGSVARATVAHVSMNVPPGEEPEISVRLPGGAVRDTVLARLAPASEARQAEPEPEPELEPEPEVVQLELLIQLSWQPGVELPVRVSSTSSVPELMATLHSLTGPPPDPAKGDMLMFNTQRLEGRGCSVAECGLAHTSRLHLIGTGREPPRPLATRPRTPTADTLGLPPATQAPQPPLWKRFSSVPQKSRNIHVLDVDSALLSTRWLRIRAPAGAEAFDAQFTVRSLKARDRQWSLQVFRETPPAGSGGSGGGGGGESMEKLGEHTGDGRPEPEPHYAGTTQRHEVIRLQVCALEPRSGDKIEVCIKVLPKQPAAGSAAAAAAAAGSAGSGGGGGGAAVAAAPIAAPSAAVISEMEQLRREVQEKSQTIEYLRREGIPADALLAELQAKQAQLDTLSATVGGGGGGGGGGSGGGSGGGAAAGAGAGLLDDYPARSFDYLEQLRAELEAAAGKGKYPTAWADIPPEQGILAPFSGQPAVAMSVKRRCE
jgi:hypothetical protein